jgi:hypothetical protein
VNAAGFWFPIGPVSIVDDRLYIMDAGNQRVLIHDPLPPANGAAATGAIGAQSPAVAGGTGPNGGVVTGFSRGTCTDGLAWGFTEPNGHRVQLFDAPPTEDAPPDIIVGQTSLASPNAAAGRDGLKGPFDYALGGGRLVVADTGNHRLLLWNALPTSNKAKADLVPGQADFAAVSSNRGGTTAADTLANPSSVWTDGSRLVVADEGNNRVLVWHAWPHYSGQPADAVVGQPDFMSASASGGAGGLSRAGGVSVYGRQLFIADTFNHRVLVVEGWPVESGALATRVLGQASTAGVASNDDNQDGTADATPPARTFARPTSVFVRAGEVWVSDTFNQRILRFLAE